MRKVEIVEKAMELIEDKLCVASTNQTCAIVSLSKLRNDMVAKEVTFEDYLISQKGVIDFSLRAEVTSDGVCFYIHPSDVDGDTMDFFVRGNTLINPMSY